MPRLKTQGTGRKEYSVPPASCSETSATRGGRLALAKKEKAQRGQVPRQKPRSAQSCRGTEATQNFLPLIINRVWSGEKKKKKKSPIEGRRTRGVAAGEGAVSGFPPPLQLAPPPPRIPPLLTASGRRGTTLSAGCARALDGQRWGGWRRTQGFGQRRRRRWRRQLPGRFGVR